MDQFGHSEGSNLFAASHQGVSNTQAKIGMKQMGFEGKEAAVHEEMKRVKQLPPTSAYATNRMQILKKILQLLSVQLSEVADQCRFADKARNKLYMMVVDLVGMTVAACAFSLMYKI